jgi:hypothetical protein
MPPRRCAAARVEIVDEEEPRDEVDLDIEYMSRIMNGQGERNVMDKSLDEYIGRCGVLTKILSRNTYLRCRALELDDNGEPIPHLGRAKRIFRLKFPMDVEHVKLLFALISVNTSLPTQRSKQQGLVIVDLVDDENNVPVDLSRSEGSNCHSSDLSKL